MSRKTYVDNAMNRSLGRVGMTHGSAVHSPSSGGGGSSSRCSSGGSSFSSSGGFSSSPKTYVDNSMNRSLGRVGMPHGSAVHSRNSDGGSSGNSSCARVSSSQTLGSEKKVYVDNAMNRQLNRVGLEHGTAVHSKSDNSPMASSKSSSKTSSSDKKVYVDNAQNRKLGRVGMEHGSAVHSSNTKEYKDNALNRKLGRVGMPVGSMPFSPKKQNDDKKAKVYVDNAYNRKHNRVGLPLGSCPISKKNEVYRDTALNRALGRVGNPWGSCVEKKNVRAKILKKLRESSPDDTIDDDDDELDDEYTNDDIDHVLELMNRERETNKWLEENPCDEFWQPDHHCDPEMLEAYADHIVPYSDLQIGDKIGHGGFGEVFIASLNNKPVAVKKLQEQTVTKKRLDQFRKEMDLFCQLDHPNIVNFIGASVERPNLAIVMELMDGSLFDALHVEQVDFTNEDKVNIMQGTVRGMAYIHGKGIAHCDLKTQNVLLNNLPHKTYYKEGMPVHAKITDFGLSKMKSDMTTSTSNTPPGTPRYSAPEILRGEFLDVTQLMKADMYSLGLVILELAVEEIAFEDFNLEQLRVHVGKKGHMPPMPDNLRLNSQLYQGLKACWNFEPKNRPVASDMIRTTDKITELIAPEEE